MRLKAKDTLSVSSAGPENILPGAEFDVSDDEGRSLVERGLAVEVKGAKAEPAAPENKMEPPSENKGIIGASAFDPDGDGRVGGAPRGGNRKRKGK